MDPTTVKLLVTSGMKLASTVLEQRHKQDIVGTLERHREQIGAAIDSAAIGLHDAIKICADRVIDKIERDKLELLLSRIRGARLLLEIGDIGARTVGAAGLVELTDYARNRMHESKTEWFGPWLLGESVRLSLINSVGSARAAEIAVQELRAFRMAILDLTAPLLFKSRSLPWADIVDFANGTNEQFITYLQKLFVDDCCPSVVSDWPPPRRPAYGTEAFCWTCKNFYDMSGITKCPKCGRMNYENLSKNYTKWCSQCMTSWPSHREDCRRCGRTPETIW